VCPITKPKWLGKNFLLPNNVTEVKANILTITLSEQASSQT